MTGKPTKDPGAKRRNAKLRERQRAAGLVRVTVVVPAEDAGMIREVAQRKRAEREAQAAGSDDDANQGELP